jgi:hypothetical protein
VFNEAMARHMEEDKVVAIEIKIKSGTIFCQVVNKRHIGQLMEFITEGNQ